MKITTKLVLDMSNMEVLEEESFEYAGEVAHCGGGGSSGEVSYPEYMMTMHHHWLNTVDAILQTEIYRNPHSAGNVFDPSVLLSQMSTNSNKLDLPISSLDINYKYDNIVDLTVDVWNDMLNSSAKIDAAIDAFTAKFDEDIDAFVIPKFEAGMRDINAVQSSGFAVGKALIYASRDNSIAAFSSDARLRAHFEGTQTGIANIHKAYSLELQAAGLKFEYVKALSHTLVDTGRIAIVAQKEFADGKITERDDASRFQLELMTYGGNMLASIGSASVQTGVKRDKVASAIGGGLSGAAAGAMVGAEMGTAGGPWGAAIGGVIGAAAGLLSA